MKHYFVNYRFSLLIVGVILYLSFFTPPKTELDTVSNIDKLAHICMYGGLCTIIWWEYLRCHANIHHLRTLVGALILPIALSGIIELLQEYATENRSGDWADMIANCTGALLATIGGFWILPRWIKPKE